jgi:hypothetical protein
MDFSIRYARKMSVMTDTATSVSKGSGCPDVGNELHAGKCTIFDDVVFCKRLEARCAGKALGDKKTSRKRQLVFLGGRPAMDVLEQPRKSRFFKGFLEILVPSKTFSYMG